MGQNVFRFGFVLLAFIALTSCSGSGGRNVNSSVREVPDPCKLLTLDEVRNIAPEVTTATAVDTIEFRPLKSHPAGAAVKTCAWQNAANVNQVLLTTKMASPDPVEPALKNLMAQSGARVIAVPTAGPDAAAVFNGSDTTETLGMIVAQNSATLLDLRPLGSISNEKSPRFVTAATAVKTALERAGK